MRGLRRSPHPHINERIQELQMGKGDVKTAKGKRYNASYGNARKKTTAIATGTAAAPVAKKTATRAPAKKAVKKVVAKGE
jgi:30S ribosomal protein S31